MQRRVREILDEYCSKAPPVEQWPPGRRIRVRGVNIYYKVCRWRRVLGLNSWLGKNCRTICMRKQPTCVGGTTLCWRCGARPEYAGHSPLPLAISLTAFLM